MFFTLAPISRPGPTKSGLLIVRPGDSDAGEISPKRLYSCRSCERAQLTNCGRATVESDDVTDTAGKLVSQEQSRQEEQRGARMSKKLRGDGGPRRPRMSQEQLGRDKRSQEK